MSSSPTVTIRGGFQEIKVTKGFFRETTLTKGKKILQAGHVGAVAQDETLGEVEEVRTDKIVIHGQVLHSVSVNQDPYRTEFELDTDRNIVNARCSCQAGITGQCKHSAALYLFINEERTTGCTDEQQAWKTPSKKLQQMYRKGETVEKLFKLKPLAPLTFKSDTESLQEVVSQLASCGLQKSSLYKSLTAEKSTSDDSDATSVPEIDLPVLHQDLQELFDRDWSFPCDDYVISKEAEAVYEQVKCDKNSAKNICKNTIGQSLKREWYVQRKLRISASRAHKIWRARQESTLMSYFKDTLVDNIDLRYGREMEVVARKKYELITSYAVLEVGLVVKVSQPWLSASPDGVVRKRNGELIVLEIKCPSSCKNDKISVPYVQNGSLKRGDKYFTQVQLQMYCCNVQLAHVFIFSEADYVLLEVERDDSYL